MDNCNTKRPYKQGAVKNYLSGLFLTVHFIGSILIILSGYDDFSYAQKAIKLGASDYLLKPCKPEEILETVLKVKSVIESEKNRKKTLSRLKSQLNLSLPLLKEKLLTKLIMGEKCRNSTIENSIELFKINIKISRTSVIVIRIDDYHSFCEKYSSEDVELMKFAVKNITDEIISKEFGCEVFENNDDIIVLVNTGANQKGDNIVQLLMEVKENINKYLGFTISLDLGRSYDGIEDIHLSYNEALKSLEDKFLLGNNVIIRYEDNHRTDIEDAHYPIIQEREVLNCIKTCKSEELITRIEEFFTSLNPNKLTKDYILKCGLALSLSIYHLCIEKNIDIEDVFGHGFSSLDRILKLDTLSQLKEIILQTAKLALEKINDKKTGNRIIETALTYIEENYNQNLSLDTVAGSVFITPGYLSLLFKQVMGMNFVDYMHKIRVEKACEILKDARLKTYEVAYRVGYNDEKYFSQIFKKHTGMTPSQFRESL